MSDESNERDKNVSTGYDGLPDAYDADSYLSALAGLQQLFELHTDENPFKIEIPPSAVLFAIAAAIGLAFGVLFALAALVRALFGVDYGPILEFFGRWSGQALGTLMLIGVGSGLYMMRCYLRALYGLLEIGFASVASWLAVGQIETQTIGAWIGVFTAAYLIVRGLDNLMEGLKVAAADGDGE
jgi:hypothetical protein